MKSNFLFSLCLLFITLSYAQQNSTQKNNNKNDVKNSVNTSKPINNTSLKQPTPYTQKIIDPTKEPIEFFLCKACTSLDGIITDMEANSTLKYDTVCNSYTKDVDFNALDGIWKYNKTFIFSNNNYFVGKIRNYFSNVQSPENKMIDSTRKTDKKFDEIIDDKIANKKQEADRLGRNMVTQEDLIMTFDPTVMYKFMNREGENRDNFAIIKLSNKNELQNLTVGEIRFKAYYISAFKKNYLELYNADYPSIFKRFRLLTLNNFSMVIADDVNNEIHLFSR